METLCDGNLVERYSVKLYLLRKAQCFYLECLLNGNKKAVFQDALVVTSDKIMEIIHQSTILTNNIIIAIVFTGYRICIKL